MRRRISLQQNLINHVGFVFDASASMQGKDKQLIKIADELISDLKEKSEKYGQETRATMYIFGTDTQTACYDIDVLRTPSIASFYEATGGSTALIDASILAITEMKQTATLHGDHAFLLYVLTDGQENASRSYDYQLRGMIEALPTNWTLAALVPDRMGQREAVRYGFSLENTIVWDTTSVQGVATLGEQIKEATNNYYMARSQGVRGTRSLFTMDTHNVTRNVVPSVMQEIPVTDYAAFTVTPQSIVIKDAVTFAIGSYVQGSTYYQLTKPEMIQPQKNVALRDKRTGRIFRGDAASARQLLGLPNDYTKVAPAKAPDYDIFVQSTSSNRKLVPGTTAIVFK